MPRQIRWLTHVEQNLKTWRESRHAGEHVPADEVRALQRMNRHRSQHRACCSRRDHFHQQARCLARSHRLLCCRPITAFSNAANTQKKAARRNPAVSSAAVARRRQGRPVAFFLARLFQVPVGTDKLARVHVFFPSCRKKSCSALAAPGGRNRSSGSGCF